MAEFGKNEELARQQKHIPMEQAKGAKKVALAALGYKATGEQNTFGKVLTHVPIVGGTVGALRHGAARGVAGKASKNDYAAVLKSQDQGVAQNAIADVKLGLETAKIVATAGAGGAAGAAGAGGAGGGAMSGMTGAGGGDMSSIAQQAMGGGQGGGMDLFAGQATGKMGTAPNMDALKQFEANGGNMENLNKFNEVAQQNEAESLMKGKDILDNSVTQSGEGGKWQQRAQKVVDFEEGATDKLQKLDSKYGKAVGLLAESVGSKIARDKETKEEVQQYMNKKADLSQDSLWV